MPAKPGDNSAAVAAQFGISLKALRLYEQLGMLKAPRTAAGWRVFGAAETERLHAILSLKQLGLPLARIAELLRSGKSDIDVLLSVQETMLLQSRAETDHALKLIAIARERVKGKEVLGGEELAALVRRISVTVVRWTPELDELAEKVFTPEQRAQMRRLELDPAAAAQMSEAWEAIMADIDRIVPRGDPECEDALTLGRQMVTLFRDKSGDKDTWNAHARFWQEAARDPTTADQLQAGSARYAFVAQVLTALGRRGEIEF
ncbi:MAG TPA: MerR family transcriptional regulator [Rhizomicrobium sp.]|jgi:DNA-binding transcriptional MerR regulator|nr:MerR family transcriptional regulator [Rhizomicrobium sp.]